MKTAKGITLVELIVVVAIITTLLAIAFSFQGWIRRYNIERTVREIHADLLMARQKALSENRVYCVSFTQNSYTIKGDFDPPPDGDSDCNDANDRTIVQKSLSYNLDNNLSNTFNFQKDGLSNKEGKIWINEKAYMNCIDIYYTRLNLGVWNGSECIAK